MKKRKWSKLAAYALVLAALLAFYLLYNKDEGEIAVEEATGADLTLIEKESSQLERILLENTAGTFILVRKEGEPEEIEEAESQWYIEHMPDLPLDQSKVDNLIQSFTSLTAESKLERLEELTAYGLDSGQASCIGAYSGGSEIALKIGGLTPDNKYYYVMTEDSEDIYLISEAVGSRFFYATDDMLDTSLPVVASEALQLLYIGAEGQRAIEISKKDDGLIMASPFNGRVVWADNVNESILSATEGLTFSGLVEYDASSLEAYGLDRPAMEILLEGEENRLHLLIGGKIDDSLFYCMEAGGSHVYSIENSLLEPFYEVEPFSLISSFVNLVYKDDVDAIYINSPGQSYNIQLNRELVPVEKSEGEEEAEALFDVVLNPTVNGAAAEESTFTSFYTSLIGLLFDSEIEARPVSEYPEPEVTIEFVTTNGSSIISRYYEYNLDFYAVQTGAGDLEFAINKKSVELMLRHELLTAS